MSSQEATSQPILTITKLSKSFGGQSIFQDVDLTLYLGEVVLLYGPNGSGKTTLLNILTGNLEADLGKMYINVEEKEQEFFLLKPPKWSVIKLVNLLIFYLIEIVISSRELAILGAVKLIANLLPEQAQEIRNFARLIDKLIDSLARYRKDILDSFYRLIPERLAQEGIGRTWQDIRLFSTLSLQDNIAVATPNQLGEKPIFAVLFASDVNSREKENLEKAKNKLAQLGLQERATSSADKVSVGQSKRVAIMRAVQAGARILFLDEPLAGLDSNGIEEIIKILEELKSQKVTLVIIEHIFNLPYLLDIATTLWEIKDQKIERQKITNQVNKKLAQNFQRVTPEGIPVWAKEILGESPDINHCNLWQNALLSTSAIQAQHRPILEVENLSVFRGKRLVIGQYLPGGKIEGISFSIHPHQLAVLQAPNGWGKTTLIEAIAGLIPIHQGVIRFRGKPIERLPPWERIQMGLSFLQSRDNIFSNLTVAEAFRLCKVSKIHYNSERFKNRRVSLLSGGERQKVALDCAVSKGELLILDEPFSAIDDRDVTTTFLLLKEQLRTKTILIVVPKFIDQN